MRFHLRFRFHFIHLSSAISSAPKGHSHLTSYYFAPLNSQEFPNIMWGYKSSPWAGSQRIFIKLSTILLGCDFIFHDSHLSSSIQIRIISDFICTIMPFGLIITYMRPIGSSFWWSSSCPYFGAILCLLVKIFHKLHPFILGVLFLGIFRFTRENTQFNWELCMGKYPILGPAWYTPGTEIVCRYFGFGSLFSRLASSFHHFI